MLRPLCIFEIWEKWTENYWYFRCKRGKCPHCPRESIASSEHITVSLCTVRHSALFTVHYGPPRVIALMKFKPQASLDVEMHFATINSLARMQQRDLNATRGLMKEEYGERIKGIIKQVRLYLDILYTKCPFCIANVPDTRDRIRQIQRTRVIRISMGFDYAWSDLVLRP